MSDVDTMVNKYARMFCDEFHGETIWDELSDEDKDDIRKFVVKLFQQVNGHDALTIIAWARRGFSMFTPYYQHGPKENP